MEITTKAALANTARTLAQSYALIQHGSTTFMPMDYTTEQPGPCANDVQVWTPLSRDDKRRMGNQLGNVLFTNDSEVTNFDLMLRQYATENNKPVTRLLIKTQTGLKVLDDTGTLVDPTGEFVPNFIAPELNDNPVDKDEVFKVISGWLNSDEEAVSLLRHLSTALSPGWSAVKYMLLIGDGRNGKSVLLSMVTDLFGAPNVSHVTRQQIAERLPVCVELNSKLLNIVYDGQMTYIKDSSMEKTVIAGEPGHVRLLYENGNTKVQTNALFIEALNREPKTRDKSSALQKRLSRFFFPNVYKIDTRFEKKMRSPKYLGAFLGLLIDHFVEEDDLAEKLAQTERATEMQVEQSLLNSPLMQYVQHLCINDPDWIDRFTAGGLALEPLIDSFMAWRIQEGYTEYSSADTRGLFQEMFHLSRRSVRDNGKVAKKYYVEQPKTETEALLEHLKGDSDGVLDSTVVED